jgi:UDP-glucose 4-epimerase
VGTYLVTGGCGFIGSHLADRLLADGHAVRILDDLSTGKLANKPAAAPLIQACITDAAAVKDAAAGCDGIFHLAAIASVERTTQDWIGTHRVNLTGTIAVFEAARRARQGNPVPVVYASSAAIYGSTQAARLDERCLPAPASAYGADKLGCELHARAATFIHGVPTIGLRFFNVYGLRQDPRSPYSGVISIFCDRLTGGRAIDIHGDGMQLRDFVHVSDVVSALARAMNRLTAGATSEPEVFNVCSGTGTTIGGLAQLLARLTGQRLETRHGPARAGDVRHSLGDPTRAGLLLAFHSAVSLEAGLGQMLGVQRAAAE